MAEENRPSSSHSMIIHLDAPETIIYPPKLQREPMHRSDTFEPSALDHALDVNVVSGRPSSSDSMIIHQDAPVTIIYPTARIEELHNSSQSEKNTITSTHGTKRKAGEEPAPRQTIRALVVLYAENNLAMSTDLAAFHYEFEARGIHAEYLSLISLEDTITRHGPLIYGRDDIEGRERMTILSTGHPKFYEVIKSPTEMKKRTIEWLRNTVETAKPNDNIIFVIVSHGVSSGSVVIGGEINPNDVEYLTIAEVKRAVANVPAGSYFTLINTACYSGGWVSIVNNGSGNRFIHAASTSQAKASNFRTASYKVRGGTFVCALLSCLKRNEEGRLSEFVADIQKEVIEHDIEATKRGYYKAEGGPVADVSRQLWWRRKPRAFIPLGQATIPQRVVDVLKSIQSPEIHSLFEGIPSPKKRAVPDELVPEIQEMIRNAEAEGFSGGEETIYHSSREILVGDNEVGHEALVDTMIWREKYWLQARHMLLILAAEKCIDTSDIMSPYNVATSLLSDAGWKFYEQIEESPLVRRWRQAPAGCIGGIWEVPLFWICNVLGEISCVDIYSAKDVVEDILGCILPY